MPHLGPCVDVVLVVLPVALELSGVGLLGGEHLLERLVREQVLAGQVRHRVKLFVFHRCEQKTTTQSNTTTKLQTAHITSS